MEAANTDPEPTGKAARSHGTNASRLMSRARKVLEANDWQAGAESEFLVENAKVESLLELADALREHESQ